MNQYNKKRAFTLIELLVVIAIIGILATLAVVALQQARKNARDAKRIADVKQIQTALELYYNQVGSYPELASITANNSIEHNGTVYMAIFPSAPTPADGNCNSSTNQYSYTPTGTANSSYQLSFCLGNQVGNINQGEKCATPAGILTTNCSGQISGGGSPSLNACNNQTSITDSRDGNVYPIVAIGDQCWFQKNLAYLPTVHSNSEFNIQGQNSQPGYGVHGYDGSDVSTAKSQSNYSTYGVLYNWYAVNQVDLCPTGWHVPSDTEFTTLTDYLGGESVAGTALKTDSWGGNNSSSFTALPAGGRLHDGDFDSLSSFTRFWSSSESEVLDFSWLRYLSSGNSGVYRSVDGQAFGFSARCLRTE